MTGTLEEPVVTQLDSKSRDISLPARKTPTEPKSKGPDTGKNGTPEDVTTQVSFEVIDG